jgi:outer membrane lipoprotein-sorting protein
MACHLGTLMNRITAAAVAALLCAGTTGSVAQSSGKPAWQQTINRDAAPGAALAGTTFDEKQVATIKKINAYFNELQNLRGAFTQTSADNKRLRGKFYVKRPGRFRFDYASPSKMVIVSDGQYLAIQDHDLKTDDRLALDQTPFRILLRKDVDILRDARINELQEADDLIVLSMQDKNPETPGIIKLFMVKKPNLELKEWVTTDAQGLDTRIEVTELSRTEDLDAALFKPTAITLQKLQ